MHDIVVVRAKITYTPDKSINQVKITDFNFDYVTKDKISDFLEKLATTLEQTKIQNIQNLSTSENIELFGEVQKLPTTETNDKIKNLLKKQITTEENQRTFVVDEYEIQALKE